MGTTMLSEGVSTNEQNVNERTSDEAIFNESLYISKETE